ncbi:uncharacterized protein LOC129296622 isoform X2 [Prosopis cineraria]|uniref:uncharacterized protein LOC129296622 isoform X2 n=1 Tax=Prosopis cineraria TaxID=364024 RepID=UPI00240EC773|nr:uncharacterized protein LOC129296622 isoform X2 [Prosopis cineraria]
MNAFNPAILLSDPKNKSCFRGFFIVFSLICGIYFAGNILITEEYRSRLVIGTRNMKSTACESQCRPSGSEALPEGIVVKQTNLEMRCLWNSKENKRHSKTPLKLLAMTVGIKQKEVVNKIVEKFPADEFVVILFHYDGIVEGWRDFSWSDSAIHISAINQTKWWFAKRFLHPDIVADYNYIFLWDEDLGVENFDPERYLSIVEEEGLEISQPALDAEKSTLNHKLTARWGGSKVHRMYHKLTGNARCDNPSIGSPCIGWVEMMAPVFSRKSWPCVWYMIQNDLTHAWGLDRKLGYCAQGDHTRNIGIVDAEYIVHFGLPTLGGSKNNQGSHTNHVRTKVRMESYREMQIFQRRWNNAMKKDKCFTDPYGQMTDQSSS